MEIKALIKELIYEIEQLKADKVRLHNEVSELKTVVHYKTQECNNHVARQSKVDFDSLRCLINGGDRFERIKTVRNILDCGLKNAKEFVEGLD